MQLNYSTKQSMKEYKLRLPVQDPTADTEFTLQSVHDFESVTYNEWLRHYSMSKLGFLVTVEPALEKSLLWRDGSVYLNT